MKTSKNVLQNYENENYEEIKNYEVSLSDLKHFGVTDKILAGEIYLYKIYGDEIVSLNVDEKDEVGGKKQVEKINIAEKSLNDELNKICEDIENSEFDKNVEILMRTLG